VFLTGQRLAWFRLGEISEADNNPRVIGLDSEVKAHLRETLDDLVKGIRRPDKMKAACARMDRMREENRKHFGEQCIAVDLIRETRDQA